MKSTPTTLLALDTSTRMVGVAIYDGYQVLYESVWLSPDYHTVELAPAVETALQKVGGGIEKLAAVAVAIGPGSFTGLRIGLALAKGIILIKRTPLIGIPTLDILVAAQPVSECQLVVVLRAGRGRLVVNFYQAVGGCWQTNRDLQVLTPGELAQEIKTPSLLCGELTVAERELFMDQAYITLTSPAQALRRPAFLAEIAWRRWQNGQIDDPASLAPLYIHYNDPIPV